MSKSRQNAFSKPSLARSKNPSKFSRIIKILWVVCRLRLDQLIPHHSLPFYARALFALAPWHLFPTPKQSPSERLRLALEELGPIFIKFGQLLSTRRDLLSDALAEELKKLQDQVPAFDKTWSRAIIEQQLGKPVSQAFARFDDEVMASASIAQVHSAQLHNGQEVIIKVIRPNIEKTIQQDIALMKSMARFVENYSDDGRRLRPQEIVADYERTIFDELDLLREAANASQLRRNFIDSEMIYMPEVYWDLCRPKVLVMERIYGIPVADIDALRANNTNMKVLAERGVEIFFTQVFRDSFFHADMHPGNIFVSEKHPESPQYIAVDFGIVGTLSNEDQTYLARNLLAFFNRDYKEVAQLHVNSGWVPAETSVEEFEAAIRTVCEPIFERPLSEISFGQFLLRLFQTARRFDMEVQPQLVLLQKTLINIEGLGRQLYPELDLWSTAKPFLERWMKDRLAPPGVFRRLREQLPDIVEQSPELPRLIYETMDRIRNLESTPQTSAHAPQQSSHNRSKLKPLIGLSLVLGGIATAFPELQSWLKELPTISLGLVGIGIYLILFSEQKR